MSKPKVALVPVANHFESGGERWEDLFSAARKAFEQNGLEVLGAKKMVWDAADALEVVDQLQGADPDLLVIIHVTWVQDTIQYLFVNNLKCPVVLWAVPFIETFSLGCVQHFASILWENCIPFKHVYGMPQDKTVAAEVVRFASSAAVAGSLKKARIALIGPRQTWRVANAQDMSREEWDFSKTFGVTIVHIDMSELIGAAEKKSDAEAQKVLEEMKSSKRLGTVKVDNGRLEYAAKIYLGAKELFKKYGLSAAAAECYPEFGGLVNLSSSWLADEGLVLDTEGDIGHTLLLYALYQMGKKGPAALSEIGSYESTENCFYLDHEGSSAHSLAEEPSQVHIQEGGEGTMVGFPFKQLPKVTVTDICGNNGLYKVLILTGSTEKIDGKTWAEAGSKLLIKVKFEKKVEEIFNRMLAEGVDHHLLVKEGDVSAQLEDLCNILGMKKVII
jgi:L-fucose isomerase-like protein